MYMFPSVWDTEIESAVSDNKFVCGT